MIGHPSLRKVVSADAFRAIPGANLALSATGLGLGLLFLFRGQQSGLQQAHCTCSVLVLGAFVLAFHYQAAGVVGNADCGVSFVDVLAASAGCSEGIDSKVGRIDFDLVDFFGFRDDGHGTG